MDKQQGKTHWKSIDEKYNTPEFQALAENEFQTSPLQIEDGKDGLARRQFMKLMGASMALSGAACVRRPVQKIIPYNKRPPEVVPGIANYYASSFFDGSELLSTVVKTREGRPLHVQGNPESPINGGGLSVRASAHILSLYDPDRIQSPMVNSLNPKRTNKMSVARDWDSVDTKVVEQLKKGDIHFLVGHEPSGTVSDMLSKFANKTSAKLHYWSPINSTAVSEAHKLSYGSAGQPKYLYNKAKTILSVDADFLGTHLNPVESSRLFNEGRNPDGGMSRLISFQSVSTLTSFNADDNYAIKPSQQLPLVLSMIHELLFVQKQSKYAGDGGIRSVVEPHAKAYMALGMSHENFSAIVSELWENHGQSLVVAGGLQAQTKDAVGLQIAVNLLNSALGNDGKTIDHNGGTTHMNSDGSLEELLSQIKDKKVKTLILHNVNPAFNLPRSQDFMEALTNVEMVISTSNWMDESASLADVVAPAGHPMENWEVYQTSAGTFLQQPTISPLYKTRSLANSLITWSKALGAPVSSSEDYFSHLKNKLVGSSDKAWFEFLQKGFKASASSPGSASFNVSALNSVEPSLDDSTMELVLYPKVAIRDGSMGNVSWLHELPDPVSKIVWDNYLCVAPSFAKEHGFETGDIVKIKAEHGEVEAPIYVAPGQHPQALALAVGYGHRSGGSLQEGVGTDVSPLVNWGNHHLVYSGHSVEISKTGGKYALAQTQGHQNMHGRALAIETTQKNFKKDGVPFHKHPVFSIWGKHEYNGHKWGMGVDLNSCTGCSACMVACQSENNIPVVGKKYILGGREMHWIRIDRYYSGDENKNPDTIFQPVMCQHCENAPCESVCPVLATVHSDEGLNEMVYNRCVGTRYCANNCPYKVRRFNWFYYGKENTKAPLHMALNPDVTVRSRGVMEKCSFCVHRIQEAKGLAKDDGRVLKDGDVQTACQSVCPTNAIVFGDLNDDQSAVSKWFNSSRKYTLLEEFNAAPRVRYLAKIRNTEREMGGDHHGGGSHGEDHSSDADHKASEDAHGAGHEKNQEGGH